MITACTATDDEGRQYIFIEGTKKDLEILQRCALNATNQQPGWYCEEWNKATGQIINVKQVTGD